MIENNKAFETWAVVEVMGHKRFAGFVSEQTIAGAAFVRVDVPEVPASTTEGGYRSCIPAYEAPRLTAKQLSTLDDDDHHATDYLHQPLDDEDTPI